AQVDWDDARFDALREEARQLLAAGFGAAPLQAVKDPRLCLTLPFWLSLCAELGIATRVCVINRAPIEVARSLEKRDGFPPGYGLRLYAGYRACSDSVVPADALYVRYDDLLRDAPAVMAGLATELPLATGAPGLASAVRGDLRHQESGNAGTLLSQAGAGRLDPGALAREIETAYPVDDTLRDFARRLAARGLELDQVGQAHTAALATLDERDSDIEALSAEHRKALATIDQRDADIETLAAEHRHALATIDERDGQIRELDRRLSRLGDEHSHALQVLRERDAELAWIKQRLEAVSKIPGVGYLIRRLRQHAQG
ncbi:MAG: hypothetical protein OEW92_12460, partial [Gammaproteobacteria bacterium]|nr:hypothetical protein [Gammaproteobacteria bacterium]